MNKEELIIVQKDDRFIIVDKNNNIIDDAQGYGYKTKEIAAKALWWKFKGGKEAVDNSERKFQTWLKSSEENKSMFEMFNSLIDTHFKEIAIGETKLEELFNVVENEMNNKIDDNIKCLILKHIKSH